MNDNKEIVNSIPKEAWGAALEIVEKLIYPVTATTVGIGKLIEQKLALREFPWKPLHVVS